MAKTASQNHPIQVESSDEGTGLHLLTVTVPAARVRQEFDHTYQAVGRRVRLPGFRPGKVPVQVLRKQLGDEIVEDAREHLFEHVIGEALHQSGLRTLRILDFDPKDLEVSEDADLQFEFRVECEPAIDLPPWEEVKVVAESTEPTEEQMHQALESLGRDRPRFEEVEGGAVDDEHLAEVDLAYFREGAAGPTAEGLRLGLASPLYGSDPEAYAAALKGGKAGDEIRLEVEFRDGFTEADWVGTKGEAAIKLNKIVKPRPGTPPEVAEDLGLAGEEELSERVREGISRENEARERRRQAYEILEAIGRLRPFELPARLLEEETEAAVKAQIERMEKQGGMPPEEAAAKAGQLREQIGGDADRRLRHYFLIRKVAETEKIRVSESDLERAFRALGAQHQADPKAVRAYYEEKELTSGLRREILEGKVRERLLAKVSVSAPIESPESDS